MFSGIVKITDLDDYITPSQNCIKPLLDKNSTNKENTNKENKKNKLVIENDNIDNVFDKTLNNISSEINNIIPQEPDLIKVKDDTKNKAAKVNLYDCLACSGCVTTAETILIEQHSIEELLKNCFTKDENKQILITISPQTVLSLSRSYDIDKIDCLQRLIKVFSLINIDYVINYQLGVELSLDASYTEFNNNVLLKKNKSFLLSSECPGWICYAEKKTGEWIEPYLSSIKSPQQIIGHLGKLGIHEFNKLNKLNINNIYHCVIMPCFDKKLESTRHENMVYLDNVKTKEVDNVISTLELEELFKKINYDFKNNCNTINKNNNSNEFKKEININNIHKCIYINLEKLFTLINTECNISKEDIIEHNYNQFFAVDNNISSNGYAEYILERYLENIEDQDNNIEILRKNIRNSDFKELILYDNKNKTYILKLALVYGFRNIQNLLRKKDKHGYNYIEIMACPGGCLNGGAQYKTKSNNETSRDVLKDLENIALISSNQETSIKNNSTILKNSKNMKDYNIKLLLNKIYKTISFNSNNNNSEANNSWDLLFKTNFKTIKDNNLSQLKW